MAAGRPRVLIADDHPIVRASIRRALEQADFEVCAEAEDGPGAVEAAIREAPELCLLDVQMPGNGIRAAEAITQKLPAAAVVMISAHSDDDTLLAALRAGAVGYLPKTDGLGRLPEALHGVLRGEAALPRRLTARVLAEFGRSYRQPVPGRFGVSLTGREADVLQLIRRGCTTAEISQRLFLSTGTVRCHVSALLRKFEARDRRALQALFIE